MTTYFGATTQTATSTNGVLKTFWPITAFTCPGSGQQVIKELSVYAYGAGKHRIAVYDSTGATLICQGAAYFTMAGAALVWQGHLTQTNLLPGQTVLVGGTTYLLALGCGSDSSIVYGHSDPGGNQFNYNTTDGINRATLGFSGALPSVDATSTDLLCIRCGVESYQEPLTHYEANLLDFYRRVNPDRVFHYEAK